MRSRRAKRFTILPVVITLLAIAIAVPLCWAMWYAYMEGPWTRDGTVRVYVDRMAPEVEGKIVALPVHNNQYVHKGELLVQIDPTNYAITVKLAEATVRQDQDNLANLQREAARRNEVSGLAVTLEQRQSADTAVLVAEAGLQQAQAQLEQAKVNLERTQIRSPANGWVTNLLAQLGDYAKVGATQVSVVDANSFWVDGYFEETSLSADPCWRPGQGQAARLCPGDHRACGGHRPGDRRAKRAAQRAGHCHGQSDLHLGEAGAACPG